MEWSADFGENSTPRHHVGIDFLLNLLLVVHYGPQQTVQVLGDAVVVLDELVETLRQICPQLWRVIPPQGPVSIVILMLIVVGEACEFLESC